MKRFGVMTAGFAILVAGCSSLTPQTDITLLSNGFQDFRIQVAPNSNGTIRLPGNAGCRKGNGNKDGCLGFPAGTYGVINFSVTGPGHDNEVCGDNGVRWVITKLQIAETGDIDTGKSTSFGSPVSQATQSTLYPFEDPATGTIYEKTWETGSTSVQVMNRNDNAPNTTVDFWYYLEATECDDPHTVAKTDPRIENDGR